MRSWWQALQHQVGWRSPLCAGVGAGQALHFGQQKAQVFGMSAHFALRDVTRSRRALQRGVGSADRQVRFEAFQVAVQSPSLDRAALLQLALHDSSERVRLWASQQLRRQNEAPRWDTLLEDASRNRFASKSFADNRLPLTSGSGVGPRIFFGLDFTRSASARTARIGMSNFFRQ